MSDEDMDNMENRMESMMEEMGGETNPFSMMMNMGQPENEGDEDLMPGSSATFPLGGQGRPERAAGGTRKLEIKTARSRPAASFWIPTAKI